MSAAKCSVCDKTAYPMESVRAIDKTFHKACFRCSECQMSLNLKTIESLNGVLFCKVHLPKASSTRPPKPAKTGVPPPSSASGGGGGGAPRFGSAGNKCPVCAKTVYPTEQVAALGMKYHKACFRCSVCQMSLNLKSFQSKDKILYCKPHLPKVEHTVVADDVNTQRALNAPKRTMAMGIRSDGEMVDATAFSEDDFQREAHLDSVNQTTESVPGQRDDYVEEDVNTGGGGGWGAPPASGGGAQSGGWGAPAPAAEPEPAPAPAPAPAAEESWGAEPAAEESWGAEPAAEEAWGAEPAAEEAWGAEPAAEEAWGAEPAAEEAWGAEPAAEEWGAAEDTAGGYIFQARALYEYEVEEEGEVGFPEGAIVNVVEELSADWWQCEYNGAYGMAPSNYMERI